jgi:hypothetical protein
MMQCLKKALKSADAVSVEASPPVKVLALA